LNQNRVQRLQRAEDGDPFSFLGPHAQGDETLVRAWLPGADAVDLLSSDGSPLGRMHCSDPDGLFELPLPQAQRYCLRIHWPSGVQETEDPYAFGPLLGDTDLYLFAEGNHRQLWRCLGAAPVEHEGVAGVRFAVWAPNARRVSVVGNFNSWDGRRHPMRLRYPAGCGNCSFRGCSLANATSTKSLARMASCRCAPTPWRRPPRCRRPPPRRCRRARPSPGRTSSG